jgi:threonylcarbamoyladenosine tRNA methylthiotransferase CDKAL1
METLIHKGRAARKPLVVAGCVPQGSKDLKELDGISLIGVQQIDHIVEVVEETLKGHEVRLLKRSTLPALNLPKVSCIINSLVFDPAVIFKFIQNNWIFYRVRDTL